jgi:hypothetical protein
LWFCDKRDEAEAIDDSTIFLQFASAEDLEKAWNRNQERVLEYFKREYPGSRPSHWWMFSAPKAAPGTYLNKVGTDLDRDRKLPEPRRKLSGLGRPSWELMALVPYLEYGLPMNWTVADTFEGAVKDWLCGGSVEDTDPPKFESQAEYLKRHSLLTREEENRADFTPAVMEGEEPCGPNCKCGRHGGKVGTRGEW